MTRPIRGGAAGRAARVSELRGSSEADVIIDRLLLNCTSWRHHRTRHSGWHRGLSERAPGVRRPRGTRIKHEGGV